MKQGERVIAACQICLFLLPARHVRSWLLCIELSQQTAMSAMASYTWTSLTTADYDTESARKREDRHKEEREKEKERPNKTSKANPPPPGPSHWCVRGERPIQGHPLVASTTSCSLTGIYRHSYQWCRIGVLCYWRFRDLVSLHRLVLCGAFVPIWDALFGHQGLV